jgi:hypothetical protein
MKKGKKPTPTTSATSTPGPVVTATTSTPEPNRHYDNGYLVWRPDASINAPHRLLQPRSHAVAAALFGKLPDGNLWQVDDQPGKVTDGKNGTYDGYFEREGYFVSGYFCLTIFDVPRAVSLFSTSPQVELGGVVEFRFLTSVGGDIGILALFWNHIKFHTDAGHGLDVAVVIGRYNDFAMDLSRDGLACDSRKLDFDGSATCEAGRWTTDKLWQSNSRNLAAIMISDVNLQSRWDGSTLRALDAPEVVLEQRILNPMCKSDNLGFL